jgi:hypothetical protein
MNKIICRSLALILLTISIYSQINFQNIRNLFLYLGFIFSLLAFGEYEINDLLIKFNAKEIKEIKINTTWLGKLFELLSLISYATYIFI